MTAQKTTSNTTASKVNMMHAKVARPCRAKLQYAPQNPSTTLYDGNANSDETCVSNPKKTKLHDARSRYDPYLRITSLSIVAKMQAMALIRDAAGSLNQRAAEMPRYLSLASCH